MHNETVLFLGWLSVPLIAYVGGRVAIARGDRAHAMESPIDPAHRLAELRRRMAEGQRPPRGRVAEAVRLAESARMPSPPARQQ